MDRLAMLASALLHVLVLLAFLLRLDTGEQVTQQVLAAGARQAS